MLYIINCVSQKEVKFDKFENRSRNFVIFKKSKTSQ